MNARSRLVAGCLVATALSIAACGGGGGGGDGNGGGNRPPDIVAGTLNDGIVGTPYLDDIVTTGGTGQRTFSVSGSLPGGLAIDAGNGNITGTPAGPAGESSFTVTVTDSATPAQSDSRAFTIRIAEPLAVDTGVPPTAAVGVPYNHAVAVSGGVLPYQVSADLPAGLVIDSNGLISGTPTSVARTAAAGMSILDSAMPQQSVGSPLRVAVELEVATTALPDAIGGVSYSAQLQAYGGLPDFDWEMTGGNLPFLLTGSGSMSGTPDASCSLASHVLDVRVTDSDFPAQAATRAGITLDVIPRAVEFLESTAPPVATIAQPYSFRMGIAAGVAPYTFAVTSGALPPGITLDASDGELSGTPGTAGTFNFSLGVTDQCGASDDDNFTVIVRNAALGRNDSIATATPIGNGTIVASISPSGHPNTVFAPDQDFYEVQTNATSTITIDLSAVSGEIDTVVELLNAAGSLLRTCTPPGYSAPCLNDDRAPGNLDSLLEVRITGASTFYLHVVDWRGNARPDMRYRVKLSGVN